MVLSIERWKGKLAIVTGASSIIGIEIIKQLLAAGIKVVGLDSEKESTEELFSDYQRKSRLFYLIETNTTIEDDVLRAFQWAKENVGPINILINCAQLSKHSNIINGSTKLWKQVLDTNVIGLCIATREAIEDMKTNQINGHIIYINYCTQDSSKPNLNISVASKEAVKSLAESLRHELQLVENNIKISVINPSIIEEDLKNENINSDSVLSAEDIADAVIYTLSTPPHVQICNLQIQPIEKLTMEKRIAN